MTHSYNDIKSFALHFINEVNKYYNIPLREYLNKNPNLITTCPGFLVNPTHITVYVGRTHLGIEYRGSISTEKINPETIGFLVCDFGNANNNLMENIIGFDYEEQSTSKIEFTLPPEIENLICPTMKGWSKLIDLRWNFIAQDSVMSFNGIPKLKEGQFTRVINSFFFDEQNENLETRHILWLDLIPVESWFDENNQQLFKFNLTKLHSLVEHDAHYQLNIPDEYKFILLPRINRFIELYGNKNNTEKEITKFLSNQENNFILISKFGAEKCHYDLLCEFQDGTNNKIKPDFFVVHPDGYADIVDFKLPYVKGNAVVGTKNREKFSEEINSYIAQMRIYAAFFDDPRNRDWFEKKYGFKVYKPKKILIMGRRNDFDTQQRKEIENDHKDLTIYTYDDLIDSAFAQFYHTK